MEINNRAGHARINARGDCVDLAGAGSGRRNENPPALAVGSVKGWFGGTPLHEPAYRGIAKRSKAWDFDSHIRRFKSCYPCQPPVGVLRARS